MQKMWVWSLGREDPMEEEMATHSSILVWEISWTEKPGRQQSTDSQESDMTCKQQNNIHHCVYNRKKNLESSRWSPYLGFLILVPLFLLTVHQLYFYLRLLSLLGLSCPLKPQTYCSNPYLLHYKVFLSEFFELACKYPFIKPSQNPSDQDD